MKFYLSILLIGIFILPDKLSAQEFPSEIFHKGKAITISGDTIEGKVKYDMQNDMIQVISEGVVYTLTARKLMYFTIFDETVNIYRTFYAIPYNVQPDYKVPRLFEVLHEGQLSLLGREIIVQETVPQYSYMYRGSINTTRTRLAYEFYFLDKSGNFILFNNKKSELYSIMRRRSQQIKQYIKKNNLKIDMRRDLVRITAYYNALLE